MACKRLNIVLVGKTGSGKSATGNNILNRKAFTISKSSNSCTDVCQLESARHEDYVINVIDTPGIFDTKKTREEIYKKIEEAMSLCQGGFNAFILVLRCDVRYTDEEIQTYNIIKSFFGPEFLNVCSIAFTRGDVFEDDDDPQPFDEWIKEEKGKLKEIIEECNYRVIQFYNSKRPEYKDKSQAAVNQLLKMIVGHDIVYTDENFQKAAVSREKSTIEAKLPQLQAKYQEQLSLLQAEYENALNNITDQSIQAVLDQARATLDSIIKDDDGTEALNYLKVGVEKQIQHINQLKHSKSRDKLRKLAEYNMLLKDPPSKIKIALVAGGSALMLLGIAAAVAATIAAIIWTNNLPWTVPFSQVAQLCGKQFLDLAAVTKDLVFELYKYRRRLHELGLEI